MLNERSSPRTESRVIRKLKVRLLPFLFTLYVIAFIDRVNLGFAALTMNKELGVTSEQFGLAAGIFFFGYFIFEVPSNLLLHRIGARIWIARILMTWGVVAAASGFVHSAHQLYAVRLVLGLAEAGYSQRERAQAIALFMAGLPVASIIGAPISGIILDRVHWLGLSSWRWLLILEDLPAMIAGVVTYFALPNRPVEARFLTQDEKDWISSELAWEASQQTVHATSAWRTLLHGRVWYLACSGIAMAFAGYTLNFWMPQAIKSLSGNYSNTTVGILVTIPYVAGLLAMVLIARSSDRRLERRYHAAVPALLGAIACSSLGVLHSACLSVFVFSVALAGIEGFMGVYYSLPSEFLGGYGAASGIALMNSVANLGGFAGPYAVGWINLKTGSLNGGFTLAGLLLFAFAASMLLLPRLVDSTLRK